MADEDENCYIAQATEPLNADGSFANNRIICRYKDTILEVDKEMVDYMDVSPRQLISVPTSLIPFLQNDDTARALMGANMQRQAVPLITTEAPIIATGMEHKIALDNCAIIVAKNNGVVTYVDGDNIEVTLDDGTVEKYELTKFTKTNQESCINQKPIVKKGQKVKVDQFIYTPASASDDFAAANDDSAVPFYRIKGEKDAYLSSLDVTPRKAMKAVAYDNLHYTFAEYTQTADMPIYTINGTPSDVVVPHAATNAERNITVDRLMYIWVPSEKKAELFYHISSQYVMAPEGDVYKIGDARKFVGDGFVKQNDVKVSGVELKPVNTPEEAEQDSKTATASDKQALQNEIDKHTDVEKSDAYRLTSRNKREAYDTQLKLAQEVEKSNTSTIAAVKLAVWSLQQKTNDLDGAKVHVKNVKQLTESEALKVYHVAYNANDVYTPQYNYLITIRFSDHNRKLSMSVRHYSKATQDPKYLINTTNTELKISDYATDK